MIRYMILMICLLFLLDLKSDGNSIKAVTAGIGDAVKADEEEHLDELIEIAAKESLKMISFTITEKGYACTDISRKCTSIYEKDIDAGPENLPQLWV